MIFVHQKASFFVCHNFQFDCVIYFHLNENDHFLVVYLSETNRLRFNSLFISKTWQFRQNLSNN